MELTADVIVPTEVPNPIEPPLNCTVEMAFGANPEANPLEWEWTDVTDDVKKIKGIGARRGRQDESRSVKSSAADFELTNDDGRYTPDNPSSPYYGQIRVGTPVRIMPLPGAEGELITLHDTFSRILPGQWGLPDAGLKWAGGALENTHLSVDGSRGIVTPGDDGGALVLNSTQWFDGDIFMKIGLSDIVDTDTSMFAGFTYRWIGYYLVTFLFNDDGSVDLQWYNNLGNVLVANISNKHTYTAGDEFWVRVHADGDRHLIKTWKDGDPQPPGFDLDITDSGTPMDPGLASGPFGGLGGGFVEGWISAFVQRVGESDGTEVSFDDVIVVARNTPLFFGHVAEWIPIWPEGDISTEYDEGYSKISVIAGGPLRRILQDNSVAFESPMSRAVQSFISQSTPIRAYWPMEESGRDVTNFASTIAGVTDLIATPPFATGQGDMSTIPGSEPLPQFDEGSSYVGDVPNQSYPHGWIINHLFYMEDSVAGEGVTRTITRVGSEDSDVSHWRVRLNSAGNVIVEGRLSGWTLIDTFSTSLDDDAFYGRWMLVSFRVSMDGPDLAFQLTIYAAETLAEDVPTETVLTLEDVMVAGARSAGRPSKVQVINLGVAPTQRNWGHIIVASIESDFSPDGTILFEPEALSGYDGENAAVRVRRLASEEEVPISFILTESGAQSERMGPQRAGDSLADNLNDAEQATGAILYESRHHSGLVWRERSSMYKQNPKLILDAQAGHVINPLRPALDDLRMRNDVTAARVNGSSARVIDQQHIDEHGHYGRDLQVNVFSDQQLPDIAAWYVHIGTQGGMRYPNVAPYLSGYVQLQPQWLLLEIGDLVRLINLPPQHPPDDVDLLIQGNTDRLTATTWSGVMNAIPAGAWTELTGLPNDMPGSGLCLTGRPGSYVSTPDDPAFDVTDLDIAFDATCSSWDFFDPLTFDRRRIGPAKWTDPDERSFALDVDDHRPRLRWTSDGSTVNEIVSRIAVPAVGGERAAIRATLDVDNGDSEHEVRFYYAPSLDATTGLLIQNGGHALTPHRPEHIITGNIDLRVELITDRRDGAGFESSAGSGPEILSKRGPTDFEWYITITEDGTIRFAWNDGGFGPSFIDSTSPLPGADLAGLDGGVGGRIAIRAVMIVDWHDDDDFLALMYFFAHSITGPWIPLDQIRLFQPPSSIVDLGNPIIVGQAFGTEDPEWTVTRAEVYRGMAYPFPTPAVDDPVIPTGVLVASPDFRNLPQGTGSFMDAQGNVWTLNGDAEISPWMKIDHFVESGTTSIAATDSDLEMGTVDGGMEADDVPNDLPTPKMIHGGYVKDGINGTTVANPNFEDLPPGTRVFTDDAGRQWTLHSDQASICPGSTTEDLEHSRLAPTEAYLAFNVVPEQQFMDVLLDVRRPVNPEPGFEDPDVEILAITDPLVSTFTQYVVTSGEGVRTINRAFRGAASGLFTFDGGSPASVNTQAIHGAATNNLWRRVSAWAWSPNDLNVFVVLGYFESESQGRPLDGAQNFYSRVLFVPAETWTRVTVAGSSTDGPDSGDPQDAGMINTVGGFIFINGAPDPGQQLYLDEFKVGMDSAPFMATHEAPHQFPFDVRLGAEVMRVIAADPVNRHNVQRLYMQRGREGTPALAHNAGTDVRLHPTASLPL